MRFDFFRYAIPDRFNPATTLEGYETFEQADKARRTLVSLLKAKSPRERKLTELLRKCRRGERCLSAACPICARRARAWWVTELSEYMSVSRDENWYAVSLVPANCRFPLGNLSTFNPARVKDKLRKQLDRSRLANSVVVGAIDFGVDASSVRHAPMWHPHFYLLIQARSKKRIRKALGRYYPKAAHTPRPIRIRKVGSRDEDLVNVTSYSLKSTFTKRVRVKGPSGTKPIKTPIDPDHQVELALCLHRWGLGMRLFRRAGLHGPNVGVR